MMVSAGHFFLLAFSMTRRVAPVRPMMDSVMRGCVEDTAEDTEVPEELCVDEELVDEVELGVDQHLGRGDG